MAGTASSGRGWLEMHGGASASKSMVRMAGIIWTLSGRVALFSEFKIMDKFVNVLYKLQSNQPRVASTASMMVVERTAGKA